MSASSILPLFFKGIQERWCRGWCRRAAECRAHRQGRGTRHSPRLGPVKTVFNADGPVPRLRIAPFTTARITALSREMDNRRRPVRMPIRFFHARLPIKLFAIHQDEKRERASHRYSEDFRHYRTSPTTVMKLSPVPTGDDMDVHMLGYSCTSSLPRLMPILKPSVAAIWALRQTQCREQIEHLGHWTVHSYRPSAGAIVDGRWCTGIDSA